MAADFDSKLAKRQALSRVFTPSAPISRRDAFSGRFEQITAVVEAVAEPGRHVVLYGERGVGKTSLANILSEIVVPVGDQMQAISTRITCNSEDTYRSIWLRVFNELGVDAPEEWARTSPNPDDIRRMLQSVHPWKIIVLDEYDRVDDDVALSQMADTIKALSDHQVESKLVIVGVADSIEALIGEHASVQRALSQVQMPRMTTQELLHLVTNGFASLNMSIAEDALVRITKLSEGLPTYAHLLSQRSGQRAIEDDREEVTLVHVERSIADVLNNHINRATYLKAVQSSKKNNLYAQVLLACALAPKDQLGFFSASAVREPMSRLMQRPYDIPAFARHLSSFLEDDRGSVLQRQGREHSYRYRFRDPLMQPYALLAGLEQQLIPEDYVAEMFKDDLDIDWDELIPKEG